MMCPTSRVIDIDAPASVVFDILADPRQHTLIDGSGTVRRCVDGPGRLSLGATFRMRMRLAMPYSVRNRVIEFDEDRRIAWRHFHGHVWRYELLADGGVTRVTETFDPRPARSTLLLRLIRAKTRNARSMELTLERLKQTAQSRV